MIRINIFGFFLMLRSGTAWAPNMDRKAPTNKVPQLIFFPNNALFKTLLEYAGKRYKFKEPTGVSDINEMANILVKEGCIAGIEFHHPNVSKNEII